MPGGCDAQYQGQTLTFAQLEQVWIQNNPQYAKLAPLMAAIALAESGGNSGIANTCDNNGTQTSWGLWQISLGNHNPPAPNWNDPNVNAQLAAQKLQSQGLNAWRGDAVFTSGQYVNYVGNSFPTGPISNDSGAPAQPPIGMSQLTAAGQGPGGPFGAGPISQPQSNTNARKCVMSLPIPSNLLGGKFTTCIWYDSWTHGLIGVTAIVGGGLIVLVGLGALLVSSKTGRQMIAVAGPAAGAVGKGSAALAGGDESAAIYQQELARQRRLQIRQYYRNIISPPESAEARERRLEGTRLQRRMIRQRVRAEYTGRTGATPQEVQTTIAHN